MSINFTNLFSKLGKVGGMIAQVNSLRGPTMTSQVAALEALYASSLPSTVDGLYASLASFQGSPSGFLSALQALARATVVADVDAAVALPDQQVATALTALISAMRAASQSVSAPSVSAAVAANSGNSGNAAVLVGLRTKLGYQLDGAFAETLTATVAGDAQSGSATLNQEPVRFQGQPAASGPLGFDWPAGSGSAQSINCVDAGSTSPGGSGQWLANGTFEAWVSNTPTGWTVATGTAGTQVLKETGAGTFYDGAASLGLVGDSSTLTALTQAFGPSPSIQPSNQYAFNLWTKVSSVPAAGVLEVALVDGSGAILADVAGNNSAVTFSVPAMTTAFAPIGGFLRTPRVLPSAVKLRVRLSTTLSTGSTLYLDRLSFAQPTALYAQGPYVAAFSGSAPMIAGDGWAATVANSYANGFGLLFERLFGMRSLGLLLPTSGSPTQADGLIA